MQHSCKSLLVSFLSLLWIIAFIPAAAAADGSQSGDVSDPEPVDQVENPDLSGEIGNGNDENPGEWYAGEEPADMAEDSPVLLFVHGLNSKAQVWWEDNDMYQTAFDAGYQTAFVQLHDAGGESADMWRNGELLADTIQQIAKHFDGKPITIVAHSKGGVDAQTALGAFDAWEHVDNVITLSSPHHGTQLADLAFSSWAGWLADLVGMKGDGTYVMQTGYMEDFRDTMDQRPEAYYNDYYTMGGTEWGTPFSSTWLGGVYLSGFGDNDGVVPASSSTLSRAEEIEVGHWNHTTIRTGDTFPVFADRLDVTPTQQNIELYTQHKDEKNGPSSPTNQWVHGGDLEKGVNEGVTLAVEENVHQVTLDLMTDDALKDVTLIDPEGNSINPEIKPDTNPEDAAYFGDATHHAMTLDEPEAGEWEIQMTAENPDAYLLTADYQTAAKQKLQHSNTNNQQMKSAGQKRAFTYRLQADTRHVKEESLEATYRVTEAGNMDNTQTWTQKGGDMSQRLTFTKPDRVYNITIDIEGETHQSEPFQRTIIDSVHSGK